jgi:hypothetical protein
MRSDSKGGRPAKAANSTVDLSRRARQVMRVWSFNVADGVDGHGKSGRLRLHPGHERSERDPEPSIDFEADWLLNFPSHIATDCAGNLTISDTANFRVRQVDDETGIIETIAGTGAPGFSGDGGLATQAMIEAPTALAFGRDGGLYFVTGNRIREITGLPGMHRWDCRDERHYHLHDNDRDGGQD